MDRSVVVEEYTKTLRRVSQIIDNMILHFEMKLDMPSVKDDPEQQFATRPVKAPKSRSVTSNGPSKSKPVRGKTPRGRDE